MNAENDVGNEATLVKSQDSHTADGPDFSESPVLAQLLEIAEAYFAAGAIHQAMEIYFELASEHDDTPEGMQAGDRLMNIARRYVGAGLLHQARSIYERLM